MFWGLNSGGDEIFCTPADWAWGPPNILSKAYWVSLPGVKWPESAVDHPPPSSTEVTESVELYHYSPSGPSWPALG
jgi:hypothetical protein